MTNQRPETDAVFITQLLEEWNQGDTESLNRVISMLFEELRTAARRHFSRERADHTLQPTALVHQLYLNLVKNRNLQFESRGQFLWFAGQMMGKILVDYARAKKRLKRGGDQRKLPLENEDRLLNPNGRHIDRILWVNETLEALSKVDQRQATVVRLRYLGGLSMEETAEAVGLSLSTAKREWRTAKAWMARRHEA